MLVLDSLEAASAIAMVWLSPSWRFTSSASLPGLASVFCGSSPPTTTWPSETWTHPFSSSEDSPFRTLVWMAFQHPRGVFGLSLFQLSQQAFFVLWQDSQHWYGI